MGNFPLDANSEVLIFLLLLASAERLLLLLPHLIALFSEAADCGIPWK